MFGLVSRLFIKGLREKSKRGMRGAARRGTCLGKLSLGFTRRVHRDASGNIVRRPDGRPRHEPCIDPATQEYRLMAYELYVKNNWSPHKIVRRFNELKVDGSDRWSVLAIKQLLWSPALLAFSSGTRPAGNTTMNPGNGSKSETRGRNGKFFLIANLAIVPLDLWRAARRKLAEARRRSPLTGRRKSRNQRCATTLLSGTLICEYCGNELTLCRSKGKYKQMFCLNGPTGACGCRLSSSKSTRVIEDCLLGFLRDTFFSDAAFNAVVTNANALLEEEAHKPQVDTAPMKAEVRQKEAAIAKLVQRVVATDDPDICNGYDKQIAELQRAQTV